MTGRRRQSALVKALEGPTAAGRFDFVAQLATEIEARRLARMGKLVALPTKTRGLISLLGMRTWP